MKKVGLLLCSLLFTLHLKAQSNNTLIGASAMSTGYATSCSFDQWSLFNNVAGLAKVEGITAAFTYELVPQFSSFNRTAASLTVPTKIGVSAVGFYRFGDDLYSEQLLSAGFANKFGLASLGIRGSVVQYQAEQFGTSHAWTISFGGIAEITEQVTVGAHVLNINQPSLEEHHHEKIPTVLTLGLGFSISEKVFAIVEAEKDLDRDLLLKAATRYSFQRKISTAIGMHIRPMAAFAGIELTVWKLKAGYAYQHGFLTSGIHQASVIYEMKKKR